LFAHYYRLLEEEKGFFDPVVVVVVVGFVFWSGSQQLFGKKIRERNFVLKGIVKKYVLILVI